MTERKGEFETEGEKTRPVPIDCEECGYHFNARVPKGTTLEDYRKRKKGIICPKCGCRTEGVTDG